MWNITNNIHILCILQCIIFSKFLITSFCLYFCAIFLFLFFILRRRFFSLSNDLCTINKKKTNKKMLTPIRYDYYIVERRRRPRKETKTVCRIAMVKLRGSKVIWKYLLPGWLLVIRDHAIWLPASLAYEHVIAESGFGRLTATKRVYNAEEEIRMNLLHYTSNASRFVSWLK